MEKKQVKQTKQESPLKGHAKPKKDSYMSAVASSLSKTSDNVVMRNRILDILMMKK
jgi:hypothetical protein